MDYMVEVDKILQKDKEEMLKNLEWYINLSGNYSGKIRINRKYAVKVKDEISNCEDAYPTKLVYMYGINPSEYNSKYPNAVMTENYRMKAYALLYNNLIPEQTGYDEDIAFAIGLELIFKEFIDKHPQWSNILSYDE